MKKCLVIIVVVVAGCGEMDLSKFPTEKPLVTGFDGWWSLALHQEGKRWGEKLKVPAQVVAVHYRNDTIKALREAREQGRPIIVVTYSAGWHEAMLVAEQYPEMKIDLIVGIDPSYIADHDFYLPKNIGRAIFYFSTAENDLMAWARGDEKKIVAAKDPRVESIKYLGCGHLNCIAQPTLQADLENLISGYLLPVRLALGKN